VKGFITALTNIRKMPPNTTKKLRNSLLVLGFSTLVTQIILIRQVMAYFDGNELVIGLTLGLWMLMTALGARLKSRWNSPAFLHLLLAFLSIITVVLIPFGRYMFVTPGVMAGFGITTLVVFISLLPFCLVAGMLFPMLSALLSTGKKPGILHHAYALESIGSLTGGLLFSLVMVYFFTTWQSLTTVIIVNLALAIQIYLAKRKRIMAFSIMGMLLAFMAIAVVFDPLSLLDRLYYQGQEIISRVDTPYGRLVVTRVSDQVNIYQNGIPLTQPNDLASREERVHYAMLIKPDAKKVLMISGGTGGALQEVLKYPEARIDYVDIDPYLIGEAIKHGGIRESPRISIIHKDPGRFIKSTDKVYDVILLNSPNPSSGLLNRMFTHSFFRELKRHLAKDGVLQVALSGGANYLSSEALLLHSVTYNSLNKEFDIIGLVPGGRNYFLAGDSLPGKMLGEMYAAAGIENQYVNPYYINEMQMGQRSRKIMEQLDRDAGINSDIKPTGYYLRIREWLNQFQIPVWLAPSILGIIVLVFIFTLGPLNLGLFSGGLAAASAELMLLLWLQATYGFAYQLAGLIFTAFMTGLVAGSWFFPNLIRKFTFRTFLFFQLIMSAFLFTMMGYIFLSETTPIPGWLNLSIIFILTLVAGSITGLQYTSAVRIRKSPALQNVSLSYSSDLAGSAMGSMIVSVFLLPIIGFYMTSIGLAIFCLAIFTILFFRMQG
jgi:spermidine synthase